MTNSFAHSKFGLQILFIKVRVVCEGRATVSFIHCFLPQAVVQSLDGDPLQSWGIWRQQLMALSAGQLKEGLWGGFVSCG